MAELSIIIPFCIEFPQVMFTVNNLYCELMDEGIDFEIICIDNLCKEVLEQQIAYYPRPSGNELPPKEMLEIPGEKPFQIPRTARVRRKEDAGTAIMFSHQKNHSWLHTIKYDKKLSHWQAKNAGVQASTGKILWFCDAHCLVSKNALVKMFKYYKEYHEALNGTLHMPLSYMMDRPGGRLIYKLVDDLERGIVHYSFTGYREAEEPYKVPCMSTCGMMMTRELYDQVGGWPVELGIYGGGENFMNFTLAVLGKIINIFPGLPLFHYAAKRGYNWNYTDFHRNRFISSFMYGGEDFARKYISYVKGRPGVWDKIIKETLPLCRKHRDKITNAQVMTIEEWVAMQRA